MRKKLGHPSKLGAQQKLFSKRDRASVEKTIGGLESGP